MYDNAESKVRRRAFMVASATYLATTALAGGVGVYIGRGLESAITAITGKETPDYLISTLLGLAVFGAAVTYGPRIMGRLLSRRNHNSH